MNELGKRRIAILQYHPSALLTLVVRRERKPVNGTEKITLVRKEEKQKFVGGK